MNRNQGNGRPAFQKKRGKEPTGVVIGKLIRDWRVFSFYLKAAYFQDLHLGRSNV